MLLKRRVHDSCHARCCCGELSFDVAGRHGRYGICGAASPGGRCASSNGCWRYCCPSPRWFSPRSGAASSCLRAAIFSAICLKVLPSPPMSRPNPAGAGRNEQGPLSAGETAGLGPCRWKAAGAYTLWFLARFARKNSSRISSMAPSVMPISATLKAGKWLLPQ